MRQIIHLLDTIIKTSSQKDSIILDCFAGSGTSLKAAQLAGRQWIGIDQSPESIKAIKQKLACIEGDLFMAKAEYTFLVQTPEIQNIIS